MANRHYSQINGWQLGECVEMGDGYRIPVYSFSGGTEVSTMIRVKDMTGKVREFKIPMQDRICIDISPDVQVKRVFTRLGFIPKDASNDELIYCARELHPEYPGIFDFSAWEIGRE